MNPAPEQLEATYRDHRRQLFAVALSITRCPDSAEDAIHDVFCRLARGEADIGNLKAYVFQAVRNASIDQLRRTASQHAELNGSFFDASPGPAEQAGAAEFRKQVSHALTLLTDDERETIVEHLWGDLTFNEIAQIRGARLGTVTSWYRRGLEKLREQIKE